jgi:two-component system chemotaxis sensor kinase CheA
MDDGQQERLMTVFLQELEERTLSIEQDLLAIEAQEAPDEKRLRASSLLNSAHSLKGAAGLLKLKPLETICHSMEELFARGGAERLRADASIVQLLLRANDQLAQSGRLLGRGEPLDAEALRAIENDLKAVIEADPAAPQALGPEPVRAAPEPTPAKMPIKPPPIRPAAAGENLSIRVPAAKLDRLLSQSAELLIARSREMSRIEQLEAMVDKLRAVRASLPQPSLSGRSGRREREAADLIDQIERELHGFFSGLADDRRLIDVAANALDDEVRNMRLQPFSTACAGLHRLVRDLSATSGKQVGLEIHGGDVQLDRSLIESLGDIFRHLVRNAMDHGIEALEQRRGAGKPAQGRLVISAVVNGDRVDVSFSDDGRGIDLDRIRAEANKLGVQAGEADALQEIFRPGLSTARSVTTVSGRGVGLDIVRSAVESLRGAIEVSSHPGRGATFKVTLPLTLGLIRALLVEAGEQRLVIDTSGVDRVIRVLPDDLRVVDGQLVVLTGARPAPAVELRDWLGLDATRSAGESSDFRTAILLNEVGRGAAILVDAVLAEHECLVRPLDARLRKLRDFAGGSILPDGVLVLVLNTAFLGECAEGQRAASLRLERESRRKHILIAEDSPTVRTLGKTILEGVGYKVTATGDGSQAWQMLQAGDVDLIVADVDMPGLDGFELTQKVRHSVDFRNIPIVLLTGRDSDTDKRRGLEAGADAYLVKSAFDQTELLNTIGYLL